MCVMGSVVVGTGDVGGLMQGGREALAPCTLLACWERRGLLGKARDEVVSVAKNNSARIVAFT